MLTAKEVAAAKKAARADVKAPRRGSLREIAYAVWCRLAMRPSGIGVAQGRSYRAYYRAEREESEYEMRVIEWGLRRMRARLRKLRVPAKPRRRSTAKAKR